jgi:uncharacterized protein with GYD domain
MATYILLCNYTDQGIRTVKDSPKRRAAAREMGKKLGVELKAGYLAMDASGKTLMVVVRTFPLDATERAHFATASSAAASTMRIRSCIRKCNEDQIVHQEMDKILGALV